MQELPAERGMAVAKPAIAERAISDVSFDLLVVLIGKPSPQHPAPHGAVHQLRRFEEGGSRET